MAKATQKNKKEAAAAAPSTKSKTKDKPNTSPKPQAPKKKPVVFQNLDTESQVTIPVDVTFEGESPHARIHKTGGDYGHIIKLNAPRAFSLVKTIILPDGGEYEGLQAILIRPSKTFPFLSLPVEARARVYAFYFAPSGIVNGEIPLEGKRKDTKDIFAKTYAEGSKYRVALLAVNKEIHQSALPYLYSNTLKLESTTTLLDFLGQIPSSVRSRLVNLAVVAYVKTTSRNAMHFLGEASNIQHLRIDSGVYSDCDPGKAARNFHADAYKFLEAIAATAGKKTAGVDAITFGKQALTWKNEQKEVKPWSEDKRAEFVAALKERVGK